MKTRRLRFRRGLICAGMLLFVAFGGMRSVASAETVYWTGAASTDWANSGNWTNTANEAVIPGPETDVIINGAPHARHPTLNLNSGTVTIGSLTIGSTAASTLTLSNGNVTDRKLLITGHVVIGPDGTLTHTANTTAQIHRMFLDVGGNLTIETGGSINVSQKGYEGAQGPEGSIGAYAGGSHGGRVGSGSTRQTYGSVIAPVNIGSGGGISASWGGPGGGAVKLQVGGTAILDGNIFAEGGPGPSRDYGTGAGGSIFLTAATVSGGGIVSANGRGPNNNYGCGGGGRIAIIATNGMDFGSLTIRAHGGASNTDARRGAAGTVYLRTKDQTHGTLIVDNNNQAADSMCRISANVTDTVAGDVILRNQGKLELQADQSLTVYGSWSNATSFSAGSGSTVTFAGPGTATLWGNTTFAHLHCEAAGKILKFEAGRTFTVTDGIRFIGDEGSELVLLSTDPEAAWLLDQDVEHVVQHVAVSNSNASAGGYITALDSINHGGNTHWLFGTPEPISWTGAQSGVWDNPDNWDLLRLPTRDDPLIVVPGGAAHQPTLDVSRRFDGGLTIQSGATLALNGNDLTIGGAVTNAGTLMTTGTETLTLSGNVDFTDGLFMPASTTLIIDGASTRDLVLDNNAFHDILIGTPAPVNFRDSFAARELRCEEAGGTLRFESGSTVTLADLWLYGAAGVPVELRASSPGSPWNLNVSGWHAVRHVDVRDSAATGKTIHAADSGQSDGNNSNWNFDVRIWNGSAGAVFDTAANWTPNGIPAADAAILIDGGYGSELILSAEREIGYLAVGLKHTSALTLNKPLTVQGDVLIAPAGTIRHTGPANTRNNQVELIAGGDLALHQGGQINVTGRGYNAAYGPGYDGNWNGAGHGGAGGGSSGYTYGSPTWPMDWGTGSGWRPGGGAVRLDIAGTTTVNGSILANAADRGGNNQNTGSGGSILIRSGRLAGNGILAANGTGAHNRNSGGGGRIAVILTDGTDFGAVAMRAFGGSGGSLFGAAGTVYRQSPAIPGGMLIVDNNAIVTASTTEVPPGHTWTVSNLVVRNRGMLGITSGQTLRLTDSVSSPGPYAETGIALRGGALQLMEGTLTIANWELSVSGAHTVTGNITVATGGNIGHPANAASQVHAVDLTIHGNLTIEDGGTVNVNSRGYEAEAGPTDIARASHGGNGGGLSGRTYGSVTAPVTIGSGSTGAQQKYPGGGAVRFTVSGTTTLDNASITANGGGGSGSQHSGAAGGSILLDTGHLAGTGALRANGGNANGSYISGGGGRIAVILREGHTFGDAIAITAFGGTTATRGGAGTVYLHHAGEKTGTVIIDNNNTVVGTTGATTDIPPAIAPLADELQTARVVVTNRSVMSVPASGSVQFLTVASATERLALVSADAILTVTGNMTFGSDVFSRSGLYSIANNWNGFGLPADDNVSGDGAVEIVRPVGVVFMFR